VGFAPKIPKHFYKMINCPDKEKCKPNPNNYYQGRNDNPERAQVKFLLTPGISGAALPRPTACHCYVDCLAIVSP
jgi:hypothetical protein